MCTVCAHVCTVCMRTVYVRVCVCTVCACVCVLNYLVSIDGSFVQAYNHDHELLPNII